MYAEQAEAKGSTRPGANEIRENVGSAGDPRPSECRPAETYWCTSSRPKREGRGDSVLTAFAAAAYWRPAYAPPSTGTAAPVMKRADTEQRNAATRPKSSADPSTPTGMSSAARAI